MTCNSAARVTVAMYDPVASSQRPATLQYAMAFLAVGAVFTCCEILKLGCLGLAGASCSVTCAPHLHCTNMPCMLVTPGERLTEQLRTKSFHTMLRQEVGWFDDESHNSAVLGTRLQNDVSQIHNAVTLVRDNVVQCTSTRA